MDMVIILVVFCLIFLKEAPMLYKGKMYKELAAFLVFYLLGLAYTIAVIAGYPAPNPQQLIDRLLMPLLNYVENI